MHIQHRPRLMFNISGEAPAHIQRQSTPCIIIIHPSFFKVNDFFVIGNYFHSTNSLRKIESLLQFFYSLILIQFTSTQINNDIV